MRRLFLLLSLSALALSAETAVSPPRTAANGNKPPPVPAIAKIAWLAGNWRLEEAGRVVEAQWMAPGGGVMLGMRRTVTKGRVMEYEFTQIREGPGGDLFYIAQPSGQKEAAFQILSLDAKSVVFENRGRDFPRRVGYLRQADGSLLAFIEGLAADGTTKRIEFSYQRIQP